MNNKILFVLVGALLSLQATCQSATGPMIPFETGIDVKNAYIRYDQPATAERAGLVAAAQHPDGTMGWRTIIDTAYFTAATDSMIVRFIGGVGADSIIIPIPGNSIDTFYATTSGVLLDLISNGDTVTLDLSTTYDIVPEAVDTVATQVGSYHPINLSVDKGYFAPPPSPLSPGDWFWVGSSRGPPVEIAPVGFGDAGQTFYGVEANDTIRAGRIAVKYVYISGAVGWVRSSVVEK